MESMSFSSLLFFFVFFSGNPNNKCRNHHFLLSLTPGSFGRVILFFRREGEHYLYCVLADKKGESYACRKKNGIEFHFQLINSKWNLYGRVVCSHL